MKNTPLLRSKLIDSEKLRIYNLEVILKYDLKKMNCLKFQTHATIKD